MIHHPDIITQDRTGFACPEVHEGTLNNGFGFELYFRHGGARLKLVGHGLRGVASMTVEQRGTADGIFEEPETRDVVFGLLLPKAMAALEPLL
jgi:hypothetical protein